MLDPGVACAPSPELIRIVAPNPAGLFVYIMTGAFSAEPPYSESFTVLSKLATAVGSFELYGLPIPQRVCAKLLVIYHCKIESQCLLALRYDFRTIDWVGEYEVQTMVVEETEKLLR